MIRNWVIFACSILSIQGCAIGQDGPPSEVRIIVEDTTGIGIPDVTVYVVSNEGGDVREYLTDNYGMLKFAVSCTTDYSLKTEHRDYYTEKKVVREPCAKGKSSPIRFELKAVVILKD